MKLNPQARPAITIQRIAKLDSLLDAADAAAARLPAGPARDEETAALYQARLWIYGKLTGLAPVYLTAARRATLAAVVEDEIERAQHGFIPRAVFVNLNALARYFAHDEERAERRNTRRRVRREDSAQARLNQTLQVIDQIHQLAARQLAEPADGADTRTLIEICDLAESARPGESHTASLARLNERAAQAPLFERSPEA